MNTSLRSLGRCLLTTPTRPYLFTYLTMTHFIQTQLVLFFPSLPFSISLSIIHFRALFVVHDPAHLDHFEAVGRFLGKALFEGIPVDVHVSQPLLKRLLNRKLVSGAHLSLSLCFTHSHINDTDISRHHDCGQGFL